MRKEVMTYREMLEVIAARASTPSERLLLSDDVMCEGSEGNAQARLEHLYDLVEATDDEKIERFLAQYGLDQESIGRFLSTPQRLAGPLPSWISVLEQIVRQDISSFSQHDSLVAPDPALLAADPLPFEEVLIPFLWYARQQYEQRTTHLQSLLADEAQIMLERWLLRQLCGLAREALLLEFTLFRKQHASEVFSSGSRDLYETFVGQQRGEGLLSLLQEYSVLARLLVLKVEQWVDICSEFLHRLAVDLDEIEKTFHHGVSAGSVVEVQPGCSDAHHQGRTVFLVAFADGLKIVYKPRSLAVDQAFVNLLLWGNEQGLAPSLKPIRIINKDTHGWAEYVPQQSCISKQEVQAYYQRAGLLLCWLYLLGGNDMHSENLIACGPDPMLVDLETIITAGFPPCLRYKQPWESATLLDDLLCQRHSVLNICFLPELRQLEGVDKAKAVIVYDGSGLGGVMDHLQTRSRPIWKHVNTDAMSLEVMHIPGQMSPNTLLLHDVGVNPLEYGEVVVKGFQTGYRFLLTHRSELLASDGPLAAFEGCPLRFVRRATRTYAKALEILRHPKFLREGTDRWIELQVFATSLPERQTHHALWKVAESEMLALQRLDIPRFGTCASSPDLWLETGEILPRVFPGSALEQGRASLTQLDEADLTQQTHLIRTAFLLARQTQGMGEEDFSSLNEQAGDEFLSRVELIEMARHIGQHLHAHASSDQLSRNGGTWMGLHYQNTLKGFQQGFVGFNLYQGACGITLFLAALQKVTRENTFGDLIISALQPLCRDLKDASSLTALGTWEIGGTSGLGSYMYALSRIGVWLDQPELLDAAWHATLLLTEERVQADQSFDVIGGSAGALLGLLSLYKYIQKDELLQRARWCGHHLLEQRVLTASGRRAWPAFQSHPLTGFSHGTAGIAYALLRLVEETGEQIWKEAAEEALGFEQSLFLPEVGNWPDLREQSEETDVHAFHTAPTAWCHGAAGIGLARLGGLAVLDTPQIRADLAVALQTTQKTGLQEVDALCCGNGGRIELLVAASQHLKQPHLLEVARQWSSVLIHRSEQRGDFRLLSRLPRQAYNPGLFQGTAGIGYELLRVAFSDQVPSVLLWE
jgi:type 2 lantibiotic biosynthesis protein LanM